MPSWILWLSPVIVSPMLAIGWMSWAARPKGPVAAMDTVEEYARFRAALTTTAPSGPPVPRQTPRDRSRARATR